MTYQSITRYDWSREWDSGPILRTHKRVLGALRTSIPVLVRWSPGSFERDSIDDYFGITPSHFLTRANPDWGIKLTEPQATRGLAHSVMACHHQARIKALLMGLGIKATEEKLEDASAVAEEGRIDLLIIWNGGSRGAVIEAKFGHKVTPGQLRNYRQFMRKAYPKVEEPDYIVLKLDAEEYVPFRGRQSNTWQIASWASLLMRMEHALPAKADDDDFRLFRRLLWHRIDGLQQGNK